MFIEKSCPDNYDDSEDFVSEVSILWKNICSLFCKDFRQDVSDLLAAYAMEDISRKLFTEDDFILALRNSPHEHKFFPVYKDLKEIAAKTYKSRRNWNEVRLSMEFNDARLITGEVVPEKKKIKRKFSDYFDKETLEKIGKF